MPGKQMAIDADLNAGLINQEEVKQRRSDVTRKPISTAGWMVPVSSLKATPSPVFLFFLSTLLVVCSLV